MRSREELLLINPWEGELFPTPAIGYLQAAAKSFGISVRAADLSEALTLKDEYPFVGVTFHSFSVVHARAIREHFRSAWLFCGGHHPSAMPEQMLSIGYDQVVIGEGENALIDIINGDTEKTKIKSTEYFKTINDLPFPDYTGLKYSDNVVISSRGCPFKCLHGDTIIDTTKGFFKIKDLVGSQPSVLTRNPITHEPEYAIATEVRLTQKNVQLVRVAFDNGDYIDCTPDHKFITFKNGNQVCNTRETETEARDLVVGESVRAIHYINATGGYIEVVWGRRHHIKHHRLVVEHRLGRKLSKSEHIHHVDKNKTNNKDFNLVVTSHSEHIRLYHPEVAERMRTNNAAKNMTLEQRISNGKKNIGTKRSIESRLRYRNSKLGNKNPRYTDGKSKHKSRIPEINHKIVSVTYLDQKQDVYCMEVPGYDWFYANQVLVHNCSFCASTSFWGHTWRSRTSANVAEEVSRYKTWMFEDDNFTANKKRAIEICSLVSGSWQCASRAESLDDDLCAALNSAGCHTVWIGVESFSQRALDDCNKHTTVEKMVRGIETAERHGIQTMCQFIVGLPGTTEMDIIETARVVSRTRMSRIGVNTAWILPATDIYVKAKAAGMDDGVYLSGVPFYTYEQGMATLQRWATMIMAAKK